MASNFTSNSAVFRYNETSSQENHEEDHDHFSGNFIHHRESVVQYVVLTEKRDLSLLLLDRGWLVDLDMQTSNLFYWSSEEKRSNRGHIKIRNQIFMMCTPKLLIFTLVPETIVGVASFATGFLAFMVSMMLSEVVAISIGERIP